MRYKITGTLKSGKRFKPIYTENPQNYNIWRGTIWRQGTITGKWSKVKTIWN